jgi:hypothetical protein
MILPKILIIDDLTGWSAVERARMCRDLGLLESGAETIDWPTTESMGEATFCSAQRRVGNRILNDVDVAVKAVESGWNRDAADRWALVLLDMQFTQGEVMNGPVDPDENPPLDPEPEFGLRILESVAMARG